MAPSMVEPLDDLKECRQHPRIYILLEDWAVDGEQGNSSEVYTDFNDAKRILVQKLKEEQESGCIPQWADDEKFKEHSTDSLYECYIDGEYCEPLPYRNRLSAVLRFQSVCQGDGMALPGVLPA